MVEQILVVQTGGTIDKDYPRLLGGYAFEISDEPACSRILSRCRVDNITYLTVCRKDSQEITKGDRENLSLTLASQQANKILITHGTDTLIETGQYLASKPALEEKTIVICGAAKPETFKDSDADFNVGVSIGALQCLSQKGVFIAMNGLVIPAHKAVRDTENGKFLQYNN